MGISPSAAGLRTGTDFPRLQERERSNAQSSHANSGTRPSPQSQEFMQLRPRVEFWCHRAATAGVVTRRRLPSCAVSLVWVPLERALD
jgi:hypothetical protein